MNTLLNYLMSHSQEGISISKYMQSVKNYIDDLALIGHVLSDPKIIDRTLNGLTNDYKEIKTAI